MNQKHHRGSAKNFTCILHICQQTKGKQWCCVFHCWCELQYCWPRVANPLDHPLSSPSHFARSHKRMETPSSSSSSVASSPATLPKIVTELLSLSPLCFMATCTLVHPTHRTYTTRTRTPPHTRTHTLQYIFLIKHTKLSNHRTHITLH